MAQVVEVGFTLMRCEELNKKTLDGYVSYLKGKKAKIETWDSEKPEDPKDVSKDQLLETGGFTIWFGKVEMNVSILMKTATYMGSVDCPKSEKTTQSGALRLLRIMLLI